MIKDTSVNTYAETIQSLIKLKYHPMVIKTIQTLVNFKISPNGY